MTRNVWSAGALAVALLAGALVAQDKKKEGYTDTPVITGQKWKVHDADRPVPPVVTPGEVAGAPPSDAIVLFDGKDLSKWQSKEPWKVENGYIECVPKAGDLQTKDKFGDFQLHVEWASPAEVKGNSQGRGNSGVFLPGHQEVQVLDSYGNDTYPDGQAGAIYGKYPPLANACRKPGEWQCYDITLEQPRYDAQRKLVEPCRVTVVHNGIVVQDRVDLGGGATEGRLSLQDHGNPVRYRNIWILPLNP
jgi:hypothetical protein